jgi:type III restriction enzyme
MSDFSLMDAIECGIVKLPRVPVAENIPGNEMPMSTAISGSTSATEHAEEGSRQGRGTRPAEAAHPLQTAAGSALRPLREDLRAVGERQASRSRPASSSCATTPHRPSSSTTSSPAFSRKRRRHEPLRERPLQALPQLRRARQSTPRPNTCSSTASSSNPATRSTTTSGAWQPTRSSASAARSSNARATRAGDNLTDQELLREVMNTVGKQASSATPSAASSPSPCSPKAGTPTPSPTCSGIRAFGTQLLCEQVIGRALRRQSYELNEEGLFNVEYADVFGIPSTSPPSPSSPRRSRRARPSR